MTTGPLAGTMSNFTYDARNRLISAGSTSYQYDAENNRISVADSVYKTQSHFVVNPNALLSQVLIQTDSSNNQTFYIYGLGLIGQEGPGGAYYSYHFDRRGSTIALTDATGNVTDTFQYDPYGKMVNHIGTTFIPFMYNGRDGVMSDANGLYYMRARYYNPEIRRFINQDIYLGKILEGQGLNRYAYIEGNPINGIDPLGLWFGVDDFVASGLGGLGGVVSQYIGDVVANVSENGLSWSDLKPRSSWEDYTGSFIGGAAGGETLLYTANPLAAGLVSGATSNAATQGLKMISGKQENFEVGELIKDTAISGVVGKFGGELKMTGIISGRGSYKAIFKGTLNKYQNNKIKNVSIKTTAKGGFAYGMESFAGSLEERGVKIIYDTADNIRNIISNNDSSNEAYNSGVK
ncbi:MAG: RHS repeat domain-containing protein [Bacillota bacterium]